MNKEQWVDEAQAIDDYYMSIEDEEKLCHQ